MNQRVSIETLIAYVDGELDGDATSRVEAFVNQSPAARDTVRDLREGAGLVRAAYNDALRRPVPEALRRTIDGAFGRRPMHGATTAPATAPAGRPGRLAMAVAACLAIAVVGAGGSYVMSGMMVEREMARLEAFRRADLRMIETVVNDVLEKRLSGVTVDWQSAESGSHGSVTPVRTFKSVAGTWCREYLRTTITSTQREQRRAIACREPDGTWRTHMEMLGES